MLSQPASQTSEIQRLMQCTRLTPAGLGVALQWLQFRKARESVQLEEADMRHAVAIAVGRVTLPRALLNP